MRSNSDQSKIEEFNELRQSIQNRIEELEDFFEDNYDDEFIFYFERGRYKLKKLLMYEPNLLDEIDNGKNMKAFIFGQKPQNSQSAQDILIDQDTEMTKLSNNYFMNKNNSKSYQIFSENNNSKNNNNYNNKTNTNVSNNTNKRQINNNFNKNKTKSSYNNNINTNQKSNKKFLINNKSKPSYSYYINDYKNNMIKNKIKSNNYSNNNFNNNKNNRNKINNRNNNNNNYNNYYNKDKRKIISNSSDDEDSEEKKENKIKYLDWTEHNTLQQNTLSNYINTNNTNGAEKSIDNDYNNNNNINSNNINANINNSFVKRSQKKKKTKRDTIYGPDVNLEKFNYLNKSKKKDNQINDKNINNNIIDLYNNDERMAKWEDSNITKSDFFTVEKSDKDKSLSEITSNRKGEIEESISEHKEQYKEILFQIKLNKEEYRLLLRETAKIINPLK